MKFLFTIPSGFVAYSCFLFTGFFINPVITIGQGLYNESVLHLNDVNLYVDGEISNAGMMINNGFVSVTKDWDNTGIYYGSGILNLKGSGTQKITHNDQKVHSLMVDGSGEKQIEGKITITDEFHLTKGIVKVSGRDRLKLNRNAVVSGGSKVSFVDGPITTEGKGYKFFPVGKNELYAPIELLNVKNNSATYSIEVFENAPPVSVDNIHVNHGLYWERKDLDSTFGGSAVAVNFNASYFSDPDKLVMLEGSGWENPFMTIDNLGYSSETNQLTTRTEVNSTIIVLGEMLSHRTENGFYFSTALSPNAANPDNRTVKIFGDRFNDRHFRFEVFNRWGSVVYQSTSLEDMSTNGWDGRSINGKELVSGAYPYRLTAVDKAGKKFEKKGVIAIVY